ncbi:DUF6286 domain-containing Asp23/Gls24 family envelope stress response protein [Streptomyces spectabilis]|uniref:Asp23/Gls24 family envelope stress response protein n=1 Tax=Streptomyces spectabilis TaxID=68270 RepID=A0A5P2XI98_STRST|nr:DUF6286 domain-containing Asp23/Gls24 family envelope stress response protein [Streptomyces spectabilis]MBB5102533.1 hypothetical protein [Streptomyces spectabilis]MCI3907573.1 Asp23/Gls24 family envelope stress response protein [Streptomyces spectabilis]QEV64261.1 Asp23/Gls24 family envelope stress response protein [Streptomyces spectabilis]GGV31299.1 hypothetical protein GCM10010245_50690 [Streptomyces spectabilis]
MTTPPRPSAPRTPPAQRGTTTVADRAVRRVAQRAAAQTPIPGGVRADGGSAVVRGPSARVGVTVALPYPGVLDASARAVQRHVTARTAELTGLTVRPVSVHVRALDRCERGPEGTEGPLEAPAVSSAKPGPRPARRARRPWSPRRLPVAVGALVVAAGCAVPLYDMVAVHAAGRAPAEWRVRLVAWLSAHGPDGGTVTGLAAAGTILLGLWMVVLAVTPGRRACLPMAPPDEDTRAELPRGAVAVLLRDSVAVLPAITRVRVRVGRRRARVRAELAFGDRPGALEAVTRAAEDALGGCGLARPPRLRVRLRSGPDVPAAAAVDAGGGAPG